MGNSAGSNHRLVSMPVCLVVDDEPFVRGYISTILQREQFRTLEAEDGAQALQIVQELGGGVDLIVSDIQMPNGNGLSFVQVIKQSFPTVPIILISGNTHPDPDSNFEFVKKPFLPAALMSAVWKLVAHSVASGRPA
jgi:CheY-like chemotaxis protein